MGESEARKHRRARQKPASAAMARQTTPDDAMDATASHERPSDDPQAEEEAYDQLLQRMYHTQLDASAESAALQPDDVADDDWHFDASSPLRRSALNDAQDEHKSGDGDDIDATHQRASADDEERHEIRWVSDDGGEDDDDDQHNTSFGSIDWVAAHLQLSETDQGDSTMDEGVQEALAILNNSRAKFGSTRGSSVQDSMDQSDWQLSVGDDGKPYYYDIVHEAMSVMYRDEKPSVSVSSMAESVPESTGVAAQVLPSEMIDVDDQTGREEVGADNVAQTAEADSRPLDEEEKEEEKERDEQAEPNEGEDELSEEEKEEAQGALERSNDSQLIEAQYDEQTTHLARSTVSMRERYQRARVEVDRRLEVDEDNTDEPVVDEWKEAYTAKGRVYYYNRRTRESSWKRPDGVTASSSERDRVSSIDSRDRRFPPAVAGESGDQDGLFCCFCGQKQPDSAFVDHFRKCNTLNHHKSAMSPLYRRFQEFLCLLSEDASLRALHYPTAFLEPTPRTTSSNPTVQDSLRLLRPSRQSRRRALPQRSSERPDTSFTDVSTINRSGDLGFAGERQPPESNNSNPSERSTVSIRPRHSSRGSQFAEECRHCHRSFAEGRLAKHEAVCPRVFGNETTWGRPGSARHPPSYNRHLPTAHSDPPHSRKLPAKNKSLKSYRLDQRSLKTSYAMHQATLVECPCCKRKFAPSGAQQHIDICKTVQNRPKNPVKDFALAG